MHQPKASLLLIPVIATLLTSPGNTESIEYPPMVIMLATADDIYAADSEKMSNPEIGTTRPELEIDIRMQADPVLEGLGGTWEDVRNLLFISLIPAAIGGALAIPRIAAYAASGSTAVTGEEQVNKGRPAKVGKLMGKVDFATEVKSAINNFLEAEKLTGRLVSDEYRLELNIESYGFVGKPASEHACLFVDAVMNLHRDDNTVTQQSIAIAPFAGSEDAPPPYCARQKEFVKDDGALVRQALRETAIILAAIVVDRIKALQL